MKKRKNNKREVLAITIPILISLIVIILLLINIPLNPKVDIRTTETVIAFNWLGFATRAFVDDNPEFSSPIEVARSETIQLRPGHYYWKTEFLGPVSEFTIDSKVAIAVENETNGTKKIKNTGNIEILLEFFRGFMLTGKSVLGLNESLDINDSNYTEIIASRYDKR